jgi:hypothetical protein
MTSFAALDYHAFPAATAGATSLLTNTNDAF